MTNYCVEFWRGAERIIEYESEDYLSLDKVRQHIEDLTQQMMSDPWAEDWTGCRFTVAKSDGTIVLQDHVPAAMSALARRRTH
jgi:hypothetical protein